MKRAIGAMSAALKQNRQEAVNWWRKAAEQESELTWDVLRKMEQHNNEHIEK